MPPKKPAAITPRKKEKGLQRLDVFIRKSADKRLQQRSASKLEFVNLSEDDLASEGQVIDLLDSDDELQEINQSPHTFAATETSPVVSQAVQPSRKRLFASASPTPGLNMASASNDVNYNLNVGLAEYDAKTIPWSNDKTSAPFSLLCSAFGLISQEKSRNKIMDILTNLFRSMLLHSFNDIIPTLHLTSNSIAPAYKDIELGVGYKIMSSAICESFGINYAQLRQSYQGDMGDAAASLRRKQSTLTKPLPVTIEKIWTILQQIAKASGQGSQVVKVRLIKSMLSTMNGPDEVRFLVRLALSNLRIGATKTTCLIALSRAWLLHSEVDTGTGSVKNSINKFKESEGIVKEAYAKLPDFELLVERLKLGGLDGLSLASICKPGVPISNMLGKITRGVQDAVTKLGPLGPFIADFKWDGMRAQVHFGNQEYSIFSRHLENCTGKYPDVIEVLKEAGKNCTSFVLDCEVVPKDESGRILPFARIASRPRKNVALDDVKDNPVCLQVFDCMFLNDTDLMRMPLRERLRRLKEAMMEVPNKFEFIKQKEFSAGDATVTELGDWLKSAVAEGAEGIMCKLLDNPKVQEGRGAILATYEPDKRGDAWLKVKKDYSDSQGVGLPSFDLIVMGAWNGTGRKGAWYSPFLLGAWNPDSGEVEAVCKVMSGFSDDFYKQQMEVFADKIFPKPSYYLTGMEAQYWFSPDVVWEITGADLSLSPNHKAGIGKVSPERGISLRFPRFIRVRDDKGMEQATTGDELAEAFENQVLISGVKVDEPVESVE
jgi:DNA ligase-1